MKNITKVLMLFLIVFISSKTSIAQEKQVNQIELAPLSAESVEPSHLKALKWRNIGPDVGSRVPAVAGHPTKPAVFYAGNAYSGVWETTDGGQFWKNISDGFFTSGSIGSIAVSQSNPDVIYVGTGEGNMRNDVSWGDGVYKSVDAGKTWKNMGLKNTRQIPRIVVHPKNPDIVYVAAFGHAFGPNKERGVYRSQNGGKTWEKILYKSDKAGPIELVIDPSNPDILYAAIYQFDRKYWTVKSGGPDSELRKSTDGGDTWKDISKNSGLPNSMLGRIGIAVSPANPSQVWALLEAEEGRGLYGSMNGGDTWELLSTSPTIQVRPFYFSRIVAGAEPNTVWVNNIRLSKSSDGGRNFRVVGAPHDDCQDVWIDINNPDRMILGHDGGAGVSFNGGKSWSTMYNQPTTAFYRVDVDDQYPYRLYGNAQDLVGFSVPSAGKTYNGISYHDTYIVNTSESGYAIVKPGDPNVVYSSAALSMAGGGAFQRFDRNTGEIKQINVWPELVFGTSSKDRKYRFNYHAPLLVSRHDSNSIYVAAQYVFRTRNEGQSWEKISPDLTRSEPEKLERAGGLTPETTGQETYASIFALAESPVKAGVLWSGSDDGLVHVSQDDGKTWILVTPKQLPKSARVDCIEPSPHHAGTAYLAATQHRSKDILAPYLYRTTDYGKTWKMISTSFPQTEITRVIREDPIRKGLLFVGTQTSIYFSLDDGESWDPLQLNLPVVPVYDIKVKHGDLIIATHGRSFWILDDISPLREVSQEALDASSYLFSSKMATRKPLTWWDWFSGGNPGKSYYLSNGISGTVFYEMGSSNGEQKRNFVEGHPNPPNGSIFYYLLEDASNPVTITVMEIDGHPIHTFTVTDKAAGLNRYVWDMRYQDAAAIADRTSPNVRPLAKPGKYKVQLEVAGKKQIRIFEIRKNPNVTATQQDLETQFALWIAIRDKVSEATKSVMKARKTSTDVQSLMKISQETKVPNLKKLSDLSDKIVKQCDEVEKQLAGTAKTPYEQLSEVPGPIAKLQALSQMLNGVDAKPTESTYEVLEHLSKQVDAQITILEKLIKSEVTTFKKLAKK